MANYSSSDLGISLEEAVSKIEQLESDNSQLRQDLEDCKDQLFDILQQENDIPEQRVKDEFISIFDGIDSWIDDVSGDERFDFKVNYASIMQRNDRKTLFKRLGLESGCLEIPWAMKLSGLETCHYIILSLVISRFIVEDIFDIDLNTESRDLLPPGISPNEIGFIKRVENGMRSDSETLKGGKSRYPKWKGEAISALVSTQEYEDNFYEKTRGFEKDLRIDLERWIDDEILTEHFRDLRHKVLEPAYKFLHTTGCSAKTYQLCLERIAPGSIPPSRGSWNFKDMDTWRTVPSSDIIGSISYLYPGLERKGHGDQGDLVLVKPVALGYRQLDLQPQLNTSQPRERSFSPVKPNVKTVERTPASPSRTEQRRSEREPLDTSRYGTKVPRTDYGQRQSPQQASQDQPRSEYKQKKSEGSILSRAADIVFGPPRGAASASSRPQPHAAPKNEGKRSNKPREIQKAATWSPGREAEGREAQYGSSRQGGSDSHQDVKAAILGHRVVTVDPSQRDGNYGGEMIPEEYMGEVWERDGGTYRIKPRYGPNGG